jgi:CBS domain-containing protein
MSPRAAWRLETLGFTSVYEYAAGKADWGAYGLPVEGTVTKVPPIQQLARTDVPTCRLVETIRDVRARLGSWTTCFVLNEAGIVLGRLYTKELEGDPEARAGDVMRPGPSTFRPNVSVVQMLEYMNENQLDTAPVTRPDGTFVGLLLRADAERAAAGVRDRAPRRDLR